MKALNTIIVGLLACGAVFAAVRDTTTTYAKAASAKKVVAKIPGMKLSVGSLVSVEPNARTMIIKQVRTEDTITATDSTRIKIQGKKASLADLVPGSKVIAFYMLTNGEKVALKVSDRIQKGAPGAVQPAPLVK
jgi:hypothetical protein